ncbi:TonB-dependent receptor, partial [Escherichia coli]|nr:TonB-dependent receptor [Escherichia coli]
PRMLFGIERISKDKYTGAGTQYMLRANAKLVQDLPWGDLTAFLSFARAEIWGYNNTSFDMLAKLGWNGTDIFYPNYARAVFIAAPENA